ncbi:unnamed protein product, partial [Nesidiocoris tenuis]
MESIEDAIRSISIDTAPGPDGILLRTIRIVKAAGAIHQIAKIMLAWNYVPKKFQTGRTILIYKGKGDETDLKNWRPITIFSVIRRIIERSLDRELRSLTRFHCLQRGFVSGMPGTHINASIVQGCLKEAKRSRKNCCVVMLDLAKAYDSVGHEHLRKTLEALPIPHSLRQLVTSLAMDNSFQLEINKIKSRPIKMLRGVAQGSPLSPTLFNLCQDFVLKEVADSDVASVHGFSLRPDLENVITMAFADDNVLITSNPSSAAAM